MESGSLITAKEAVRRVLILENPGIRGQSPSQFAVRRLAADSSRRSGAQPPPYADGAAVDRGGRGRYTAVDGERVTMHPAISSLPVMDLA